MSLRFLDANGAEQLRARINNDPEFELVSRDMSLHLCLEVGNEKLLIVFHDGKSESIRRFVPMAEPIDVYIKGASEFWRLLLSPVPPPGYQNLYAGVRFKKCEVTGNSELYFAYFAAITRMIELMHEHQNG